jgi:DNA gyrase subunit A
MRYTEARLTKLAAEMLRDLDKETVDFLPNFDGTEEEPFVLPSRYPNLLVNGADGIAVGMATNIPPHNLAETIDGAIAMIDDPDITIDELMEYIPAPDFPTGGVIMGRSGIRKAYRTGQGNIIIRSKCEIEEYQSGNTTRSRIVVTEIPYQVNKAILIKTMADMVKDKRLEGISDIREESDRSGMRIVIEVKKDASPQVVLNTLYKHTNLQISDGINLLALVNKGTEPKVMNLREILVEYLDHQKEVIVRRTKFDLNKTEERAHIVAGLVLALANVDEVIAIIKASADKNEANVKLCSAFELDEKQANAILEMRLQRLTSLEVEKLEEELASLRATIADLQDILAHDERVWAIIKADLLEIKEKYPSPRKTQVDADESDLEDEDLIEKEDVVVSITHGGYAKRLPVNEYKAQNRGGVGITAHKTKEEDFVEQMFVCSTHDHILLFSDKGRVYHIKCYMIPEAAKTAKGRAIVNIVPIAQDEKIVCTLPVEAGREKFIAFATRKGLIKKTAVEEFMHINRNGKIAIQLLDDDALISVLGTQGNDELMIATAKGKCIRFSEENVRPMGRDTRGVKAMKLADDDKLVDMLVVDESKSTLTVTANGYGKRTSLAEYRVQGRAGKGIRAGILNEQTGDIVNLKLVSDEDDVILITTAGIMIRIHASDISKIGRSTKGVRVMRVREGEIATVAVTERDEEAEAVAPEETVTPEQAAEMAAEEGDGTEE